MVDTSVRIGRHWCVRLYWKILAGATCALSLTAAPAFAQIKPPPPDMFPDLFTQHAWSQIYPDFNYPLGCVNGYLAFVFSDNGSFVFNHRVHGSWRLDGQGNLALRTRDGERFKLLYDGGLLVSEVKTSFIGRFTRFQECE